MKRRFVWLMALAPLAPFACSSGDNTTDGGADAARDGTTSDVRDSSSDTSVDAPKDVAADVTSDASDASTGDASDGATTDAAATDASDAATSDAATSDASTTDASTTDASTTDASADASSDATTSDGGGGSSWHTPTCDGTIGSGEYGDSSYQTTSGTQIWYMTWDATNLYVAVTPANVGEGAVLYVGFSGNGLAFGQNYDNTSGSLPFKADAVVYAHTNYNEVRLGSADAGTWSSPSNNLIQFCDDTNATREEVIPWTVLGASGIPSSFRFLAYATSSGGSVYGQIPTSNPSGSIGTNATFGHDFYVSSTANGSGAFPFATTE